MSEQEKTTGGTGASGQSVVMVESGVRHIQPYRPTELQDETLPDLHHKRSRAPAVPSVAKELKAAIETSGTKERKESERAISSEKHKSNAAKKLSSNTKRRGSSPEAIALAALEVETKRASPQPIPAQVESMVSMASDETRKFGEDKKDDDDSIKEEIAELRTPAVAKPSAEWHDRKENGVEEKTQNVAAVNIHRTKAKKEEDESEEVTDAENIPQQEVEADSPMDQNIPLQQATEDSPEETSKCQLMNAKDATDDIPIKKKEISWNDKEYLQTVNLQEIGVRNYGWAVERKASIGPYFQSTSSIGGPSGITICIPKKSRKSINEDLNTMPSVINITVSKKNINRFTAQSNYAHGKNKLDLKIGDAPNATFFSAIRGRINVIRDKIRNTLNI